MPPVDNHSYREFNFFFFFWWSLEDKSFLFVFCSRSEFICDVMTTVGCGVCPYRHTLTTVMVLNFLLFEVSVEFNSS